MASTGEAGLERRPELDGLRGVAILLVLVGHAGPESLHPIAWAGVTLFFALSGYLITGLLLAERARTGRVNLGAFWMRRARRLLPALLLMLAVTGAFAASVGLATPWLPVLGYYGNWLPATGGELGIWAHTWSLSVEGQFYIAWPLLLTVAVPRRRLPALCVVGGVASLAWMLAADDFARAYHGTDTRAWALLLGAGLAAGAVGSRPLGFLASPALRWFGDRSYGIYLWHYPLGVLLAMFGVPFGQVLGCALGVGVAVLSWRYVERPLRRVGRRPELQVAEVRVGGVGVERELAGSDACGRNAHCDVARVH